MGKSCNSVFDFNNLLIILLIIIRKMIRIIENTPGMRAIPGGGY